MNFLLLSSILFISIAAALAADFDVTKYGADNKGSAKSTDAIKKAIDAAVAAGGGNVVFPSGTFLTGQITLKSKIHLVLGSGVTVKFSTDKSDYSNLDGMIQADGATDIGINGKGTLDGQGSSWWGKSTSDRPRFIYLHNSKKIVLQDFTVKNSPKFNVVPFIADDVTIKGITISNPSDAPNTDGIQCYSCSNTVISGVTINTGDDGIVLDAGSGHPAKNIHISDSHVGTGHSGVGIGSAVAGGLSNLTVTNCVFSGTQRGLYVKTNRNSDRGGTIENLKYSGITMNVTKEGICLSMVYAESGQDAALHDIANIKKESVTSHTPVIKNVEYSDIKGTAKYPIFLVGVPESPISNIKFTNVKITSSEKNTFVNTADVTIDGKKEG